MNPHKEHIKKHYQGIYTEVESFLDNADKKAKAAGGNKWDAVNHADYLTALKMKMELIEKLL